MEQQIIKFLNKTFILAAILVLGILVFFVGQMAYQNKALDQQNTYQIMVSGEGKVYAKPDVAIISLGVTTTGKTVAEVTKSNTDKMNGVISAIKKLGINDKDIQSTNYNLSPNYENITTPLPASAPGMMYAQPILPTSTTTTLKGYTLEQDVQVKIRDFSKIGDVLAQATLSGSNLIGDLQFTIDNPQKLEDQARADAINQAKTNAGNLARESGINLGKLINVSEGYSPIMYNSLKAMAPSAAGLSSVPTIQPGQQEIDVTINLTYQVK